LVVGQRTNQYRVEHAEHSRRHADRQRNGDRSGKREAGLFVELPKCVTKVLHKRRHDIHSYRIADNGLTDAARRAGKYAAARATVARVAIAIPKEMGSSAETPNNMLLIQRDTTAVITSPAPIPAAVNNIARPSTMPRISEDSAPNVMRTPISKVRCATV